MFVLTQNKSHKNFEFQVLSKKLNLDITYENLKMEGLPEFAYEPLHKNIKIGLLFIGLGFSVYFMWFLRKISKGRPIRLGKLGKMARLDKLGTPWKSWQSWRSKR